MRSCSALAQFADEAGVAKAVEALRQATLGLVLAQAGVVVDAVAQRITGPSEFQSTNEFVSRWRRQPTSFRPPSVPAPSKHGSCYNHEGQVASTDRTKSIQDVEAGAV